MEEENSVQIIEDIDPTPENSLLNPIITTQTSLQTKETRKASNNTNPQSYHSLQTFKDHLESTFPGRDNPTDNPAEKTNKRYKADKTAPKPQRPPPSKNGKRGERPNTANVGGKRGKSSLPPVTSYRLPFLAHGKVGLSKPMTRPASHIGRRSSYGEMSEHSLDNVYMDHKGDHNMGGKDKEGSAHIGNYIYIYIY